MSKRTEPAGTSPNRPDPGTDFGQNHEPNRPGGSTGSRFLPVLVVSSNIGTVPRKITSYGSSFCRFYRFFLVLLVSIISVPVPTSSRFQISTKITSRSRPDRFHRVPIPMPVPVLAGSPIAPKPLVYFDPDRASVRDVDFSAFGYEWFMEFLHKLTRTTTKYIYLCLPQESLGQGNHTLVNEVDYKEFLDLAYANDKRINVYVGHHSENISNWIEVGISESENKDLYEDEDSYIVDHEEDDATYPFPAKKIAHDRFLNILCEPTESEDQDDKYVPP
ncbi:unnamed protein product [Lactuca saligna]|uniref:Uncharacterized protein n=1 Tax=Lactuca saligna TaxID=75948 RepID=A0AA35YCB2_LACSI|nr:unnamed protein product [Lactuca saligna]